MQKLLDFEVEKNKLSHRSGLGISNLDGRLWNEIGSTIGSYFGDEAMIRARIGIEARYIISLSQIGIFRKLKTKEKECLLRLHKKFDRQQYINLRKLEKDVRHDVLVMIKMFKKIIGKNIFFDDIIEKWIHWGLTSEDIDNLARCILIKRFIKNEYVVRLKSLIKSIVNLSKNSKDVVIQAKTHFQPAVPTLLGKEIAIYGIRLVRVLNKIKNFPLEGKLTGAVGNFSAHKSAFPLIDWVDFSKKFVTSLNLKPKIFTTQIESKDSLVEFLGLIEQVNSILVDLSQDARLYTGLGWFRQTVISKESGSSTMPQKVNPIDFENSAGNSNLSNWIISGLRQSLPVSWLQRDLTDKTVQRNLGLPFGYSLISIISSQKGIERLIPDKKMIKKDLYENAEILAEGLQTNLRVMGKPEAYEKLKKLTRGKQITYIDIKKWIDKLNLNKSDKEKLKNVSFENYIGESCKILNMMLKEITTCYKNL